MNLDEIKKEIIVKSFDNKINIDDLIVLLDNLNKTETSKLSNGVIFFNAITNVFRMGDDAPEADKELIQRIVAISKKCAELPYNTPIIDRVQICSSDDEYCDDEYCDDVKYFYIREKECSQLFDEIVKIKNTIDDLKFLNESFKEKQTKTDKLAYVLSYKLFLFDLKYSGILLDSDKMFEIDRIKKNYVLNDDTDIFYKEYILEINKTTIDRLKSISFDLNMSYKYIDSKTPHNKQAILNSLTDSITVIENTNKLINI